MRRHSSLKLFTVHIKPDEKTNENDMVFVREGFSWPAFILTILWTLYHRLWFLSCVIVLVNVGLVYGVDLVGLDAAALSIFQFAFQLWVGYVANDYLREGLTQQGYVTAAVVSGENQSLAERRFLDQHAHLVAA